MFDCPLSSVLSGTWMTDDMHDLVCKSHARTRSVIRARIEKGLARKNA